MSPVLCYPIWLIVSYKDRNLCSQTVTTATLVTNGGFRNSGYKFRDPGRTSCKQTEHLQWKTEGKEKYSPLPPHTRSLQRGCWSFLPGVLSAVQPWSLHGECPWLWWCSGSPFPLVLVFSLSNTPILLSLESARASASHCQLWDKLWPATHICWSLYQTVIKIKKKICQKKVLDSLIQVLLTRAMFPPTHNDFNKDIVWAKLVICLSYWSLESKYYLPSVVAHTQHSGDKGRWISVSWQSAWSASWVLDQPQLHSEPLLQKQPTKVKTI